MNWNKSNNNFTNSKSKLKCLKLKSKIIKIEKKNVNAKKKKKFANREILQSEINNWRQIVRDLREKFVDPREYQNLLQKAEASKQIEIQMDR